MGFSRREDRMKNRILIFGKWLALAVWILVAGFCYSCGMQADEVIQGEEAVVLTGADSLASNGAALTRDTGSASDEYAVAEDDGAVLDAEDNVMFSSAGIVSDMQEPEVWLVHVCGEVVNPGVYELRSGQRIFEAIELAGGFTEEAADSYLNLALPVSDGMKIEVPDRERASELQSAREYHPVSGAGSEDFLSQEKNGISGITAGTSDTRIDLNTATKAQLMALPGIGQARAEDIIRYRQEQGPFEKIEDIMKISGIKESAFQKIKDEITVHP